MIEEIKREVQLGSQMYLSRQASLSMDAVDFSRESMSFKNTYQGGVFGALKGIVGSRHINVGEYEKEEGLYKREILTTVDSFVGYLDITKSRRFDEDYARARELTRYSVFNEDAYSSSYTGLRTEQLEDVSKFMYRVALSSSLPDDERNVLVTSLAKANYFKTTGADGRDPKQEFKRRYARAFDVQNYLIKYAGVTAQDAARVIAEVEKLSSNTPHFYYGLNAASKAIGKNFQQTYDMVSSIHSSLSGTIFSNEQRFDLATKIAGTTFKGYRGETESPANEINKYIDNLSKDSLVGLSILRFDKDGKPSIDRDMLETIKSGNFKTIEAPSMNGVYIGGIALKNLDKLPAAERKAYYDNAGKVLVNTLSPEDLIPLAHSVAKVRVFESMMTSGVIARQLKKLSTSDKFGNHYLAEFVAPSGEYHKPKRAKDIVNIAYLNKTIIEPLEKKFGKIVITSGIRDEDSNRKVGGKEDSAHLTGNALDFYVPGVDKKSVEEFIKNNLDYDQLGDEGKIFHIATYSDRKNRKEFFAYSGADRIKKFNSYRPEAYKSHMGKTIAYVDGKESTAYIDMLMAAQAQMMGYDPEVMFSEMDKTIYTKSASFMGFMQKDKASFGKRLKYSLEHNPIARATIAVAGYGALVATAGWAIGRFGASSLIGKAAGFVAGTAGVGVMAYEAAKLYKDYSISKYQKSREGQGAVSFFMEEGRGNKILESSYGYNIFRSIGVDFALDRAFKGDIVNSDNLQSGLNDIADTFSLSLATKWAGKAQNMDERAATLHPGAYAAMIKNESKKHASDYTVLIDNLSIKKNYKEEPMSKEFLRDFYDGLKTLHNMTDKELHDWLQTDYGKKEFLSYTLGLVQLMENHSDLSASERYRRAETIFTSMLSRGYITKDDLKAIRPGLAVLLEYGTIMSPQELLYTYFKEPLDKLTAGAFSLTLPDKASIFADEYFTKLFIEWKLDDDKTNDAKAKEEIEKILSNDVFTKEAYAEGYRIFDIKFSEEDRKKLYSHFVAYKKLVESEGHLMTMVSRSFEQAMSNINRRLDYLNTHVKKGQLKNRIKKQKRLTN